MGNIFCQQSVPWELHCEPSELILNFFYQSLFHRFHYLHGLLFFQHFKHNVWLVVNVDVTGQCLGRERLSWSPRGVCRLGAAQAGQGQGWAAVTFLTERSRPNSPGTARVLGVSGVTSVGNDVSSPSRTARKGSIFCSLCLNSFALCLEFLWDSLPTLFSSVLCCLEVLSSFL